MFHNQIEARDYYGAFLEQTMINSNRPACAGYVHTNIGQFRESIETMAELGTMVKVSLRLTAHLPVNKSGEFICEKVSQKHYSQLSW